VVAVDKFLEMEVDNPAGLLRTVRGPSDRLLEKINLIR